MRKRVGKKGQQWSYARPSCKACESIDAMTRAKRIPGGVRYQRLKSWAEKRFGSVEIYKRPARLRLKEKYLSAGLTSEGKIRKPIRSADNEKRWDQLAAKNAHEAFNYWFRIRATDAQIAKWFAGAGKPWANPRLTDAEQYALRYRLDPDFAEKEKQRATEKRFRFPERAAAWAKDGTRWYRAAASDDGSVNIDSLRYIRRIPECAYCGHTIHDDERHIDHITPLSRGGRHSADNLIPAHSYCNLRKSDTPLLPFMFPEVFRPREVRNG